jgi:hypothetical protein
MRSNSKKMRDFQSQRMLSLEEEDCEVDSPSQRKLQSSNGGSELPFILQDQNKMEIQVY